MRRKSNHKTFDAMRPDECEVLIRGEVIYLTEEFSMDMMEAMQARHPVRSYTDNRDRQKVRRTGHHSRRDIVLAALPRGGYGAAHIRDHRHPRAVRATPYRAEFRPL